MKILHVNNAYLDTPLYQNLYDALEDQGIESWVHVVVRERSKDGFQAIADRKKLSSTFIRGRAVTRVRFLAKIRKVYRDVSPVVERVEPEVVHAHSLLSDGGVALRIKAKSGLPYVVAVRFTDLLFLRFLFFFRRLGRKVLKEAEAIVVLTPSYEKKILKWVRPIDRMQIKKKIHLIPNGLDPFWVTHPGQPKKLGAGKLRLLFVGDFSYRKNVLQIIKAGEALQNHGISVHLTLVGHRKGNESSYEKKVLNYAEKLNFVEVMARESDKKKLKEHYQAADIFVMPSLGETFGLSYIEALSQGLPIIYSKNQGLHGYYEEGEIGYGVDPKDAKDIASKVMLIKENYTQMSMNALEKSHDFTWQKVAEQYEKILRQLSSPA